MKQREVQILLKQKTDSPGEVVVQCVNLQKVDRILRKLAEDGYEDGPEPSPELIMREGQQVMFDFRGNIENMTENLPRFVFNSHIRTKLTFDVRVIDKFAQKGIHCYRGFGQCFTKGLIPRDYVTEGDRGTKLNTVLEEGNILLCEMLISLPKVCNILHISLNGNGMHVSLKCSSISTSPYVYMLDYRYVQRR